MSGQNSNDHTHEESVSSTRNNDSNEIETFVPFALDKLLATDVVFGRGNTIAQWSGNKKFRAIVWRYKDEYISLKRDDKVTVVHKVLRDLARLDPPGRFVELAGNGQEYVAVSKERVYEKICQALREKKASCPKVFDVPSNDAGDALFGKETSVTGMEQCISGVKTRQQKRDLYLKIQNVFQGERSGNRKDIISEEQHSIGDLLIGNELKSEPTKQPVTIASCSGRIGKSLRHLYNLKILREQEILARPSVTKKNVSMSKKKSIQFCAAKQNDQMINNHDRTNEVPKFINNADSDTMRSNFETAVAGTFLDSKLGKTEFSSCDDWKTKKCLPQQSARLRGVDDVLTTVPPNFRALYSGAILDHCATINKTSCCSLLHLHRPSRGKVMPVESPVLRQIKTIPNAGIQPLPPRLLALLSGCSFEPGVWDTSSDTDPFSTYIKARCVDSKAATTRHDFGECTLSPIPSSSNAYELKTPETNEDTNRKEVFQTNDTKSDLSFDLPMALKYFISGGLLPGKLENRTYQHNDVAEFRCDPALTITPDLRDIGDSEFENKLSERDCKQTARDDNFFGKYRVENETEVHLGNQVLASLHVANKQKNDHHKDVAQPIEQSNGSLEVFTGVDRSNLQNSFRAIKRKRSLIDEDDDDDIAENNGKFEPYFGAKFSRSFDFWLREA